MKAYFKAWQRYADFKGRASRQEFWLFWFFHVVILTLIYLLAQHVQEGQRVELAGGLYLCWLIYLIASLVPAVALAARRMHDIGRSGWWQLALLLPVASIFFYWLMAQPGEQLPNRWGPNS